MHDIMQKINDAKLHFTNFNYMLSPFQRIVDHWNWLSQEIVSAPNLSNFKQKLDSSVEQYRH